MSQIVVNGLLVGSTYALIALGLTLIFGIMNVVNFAHGQLYIFGGFIVYTLYQVYQLPFALALAGAVLGGVALGLALEAWVFRPVIRKVQREEAVMLVAMGSALLLEAAAFLIFGEKQRGVPALIEGVFIIGDAYIPKGRALVFVLSLLLIAALIVFINYSKPGRALRALAQDREAALLTGVNIDRISALGFALGSALAAVAGGLLITVLAIHAGAGTPVSIKAFIMIMIGGAGVVSGAIAGGFILGFAESIGYAFFPGSMTYLLIFIAMILFLIVRPQGLLGRPWG